MSEEKPMTWTLILEQISNIRVLTPTNRHLKELRMHPATYKVFEAIAELYGFKTFTYTVSIDSNIDHVPMEIDRLFGAEIKKDQMFPFPTVFLFDQYGEIMGRVRLRI